ncbi:MAG: hypothetical protein UY99_C0008G0004 [Parcubacteria group bacterium GW2011_GWA1_59_11]|nr:MAG: hypothetical protein UY99_C0008G0004 [Parcubacteria group bacterium GW2011_GWA1_59_11]
MALPPQVIEQLSREPAHTPGWSGRLLMFSATLFILSLATYLGLLFGYKPFLNSRLNRLNQEIRTMSQRIPEADQGKIVTFYSQLANLETVLGEHVFATEVFKLLETNIHNNVRLVRFSLETENSRVGLTGVAKSVPDITEQLRVFQTQPAIREATLGSVSATGGGWQFDLSLKLDPKFLFGDLKEDEGGTEADQASASSTAGTASSTATSTNP